MIKERIKRIAEDLELFDDPLEKYEYIVDLGKALPPLDEALKQESFLVKGCTSKVWLAARKEKERVEFMADSNSVIVRGLVSLLLSVYQELLPDEILASDSEDLKILKLDEIITPTRQNGVYHMIQKIRYYADIFKGS